jgi:hypothetical protein
VNQPVSAEKRQAGDNIGILKADAEGQQNTGGRQHGNGDHERSPDAL